MAGIGFVLRKLTRRDDLLGIVQGYTHSALASTGPWLFTVLSLGSISMLSEGIASTETLTAFRLIVIYNFAFSLVFCGPVLLVATRYLSDMIYNKNVDGGIGLFLGSLTVAYLSQAIFVIPFYLFYVEHDLIVRIAAIVNYFTITGIWIVSVFLTALKDFSAITRAFAGGMLVAAGAAVYLAFQLDLPGMLLGFSMGLALILFALIARVFAEYPYMMVRPFAFIRYFGVYWELAASGFMYNLAIWVDKWVMWCAPEREVAESGLVSYSHYDSSMFLAYLTVVPSIAAFVLSVETAFFERYLRFYQDIQHHAPFRRIRENQRDITITVWRSLRNLVILQGSVCFICIALAPVMFERLGIGFLQLSMFRIGVLGAFFHVLVQSLSIILAYFDLRRPTLYLYMFLFATNAGFTWVTMELGFRFYGYGYFLSGITTFGLAVAMVAFYLGRLPFQTFIRGNASVQ